MKRGLLVQPRHTHNTSIRTNYCPRLDEIGNTTNSSNATNATDGLNSSSILSGIGNSASLQNEGVQKDIQNIVSFPAQESYASTRSSFKNSLKSSYQVGMNKRERKRLPQW